ncbi:MAG TPA: DinB family protein [bacterium]
MDPQVRPFVLSLERLHNDIFRAVEPLSDREVNWAHPQLSNTIGILLRHTAGSERYWIIEVAGGRKVPRDRDAEFGHEQLTKDALVADLRAAYDEIRAALESLRAEDLTSEVEIGDRGARRMVPKGFALLHSLQHTSYHLGQIQLFKKLTSV